MPFALTHDRSIHIIGGCITVVFLLLTTGGLASHAIAQPPVKAEPADAAQESNEATVEGTIVAPPGATLTQVSDPYDTYAVWRAEDQVKRARNGLIATSIAFGVGWIFMGSAASQCNRDMNNELVCNNAGRVLGTIGIVSTGGGLVGMVVSGILLPVRQKKERDIRRSIHQGKPARLQWDVESGKVLF